LEQAAEPFLAPVDEPFLLQLAFVLQLFAPVILLQLAFVLQLSILLA
jgi:hypothetical protein